MSFSRFKLIFCIFLLTPLSASASVFFEPTLIYQSNGTYDPQAGTTYKLNTIGYGLKLGYNFHEIPILLGGEYFMTSNSAYKSSQTTTNSISGSENWFGAFVGFRLERLRIIGTYLISDNQEIQTSDSNGNSLADIKDKGTGYKVGVYYDLFRHMSLGVEYYEVTYTSESNVTAGTGFSDLSPNAKRSAVMASLSFPFHVLGEGKARR